MLVINNRQNYINIYTVLVKSKAYLMQQDDRDSPLEQYLHR